MKDNIPFHHISPLESMIIDIQDHSQSEVWQTIEEFKNPYHRIKSRKLFAQALQILERIK